MSVSTLSASTYANTDNYTAKLRKFEPKDGVTTVVIPKFIGISQESNKYAVTELYLTFQGCTQLTSITIPGSVTSIGDYAFEECRGLTSITIPGSVASIGGGAFQSCWGLTSITVASGNAKYHDEGNCVIETESKTLIAGCKNSIIPTDGSVTSIGQSAFYGCSGLTSITIPDSVTSIGGGAFEFCSGLTSIDIGAGIQEVSWLPNNVSEMTISISENNPYLATDSKAIFAKSNGELSVSKYISTETTYSIPSAVDDLSVTSIGDSAFYRCRGLTSITIPDSVKSIRNYAFHGCTGLTSVTIGNGVTSIGQRVFWGCFSLTTITIPDSVTSIGGSAFSDCSGLTSVVIKGNITEIPYACFNGCSSLESIVLPSSITTISNKAFSGCSKLTTIYVDSADATTITGLGFAKVDDTLYNENGIADENGKYYKYSGAIA